MNIKGFIKNSFLDWDGKITSIVFTGGCNFLCRYCHNKDLVLNASKLENIDEKFIFSYLSENLDWIDGVVISGGEPTINKDLDQFIKKIKNLKLLIKLDTNGYNPEVLKNLLDNELLDYCAMDIKTSLYESNYKKTIGEIENFDFSRILESMNLLCLAKEKNKNFDFEFRTTLCPPFVKKEDLLNIAEFINKTKSKWYLQQFRKLSDLIDNSLLLINSYSLKDLENIEKEILTKFPQIKLYKRY